MTIADRNYMENQTFNEIERINKYHDFPIGSMMLECYGNDLEHLSTTELYELQDALRLVDDES